MKVGAQPPVPFIAPIASTCRQEGRLSEGNVETFIALVEQVGMEVSAIYVKRTIMHLVDTPRAIILLADWEHDMFKDGYDVVFVVSEKI